MNRDFNREIKSFRFNHLQYREPSSSQFNILLDQFLFSHFH